EGPVMVIAGPGTGKTQILTLRIANILEKTDTSPDSILALTFTESGVVSMRRRLAEIIGSAAYYVQISTFHSFCNEIIRVYPEEFPSIIGASSITDIDQIKIFENVIENAKIKELRPFGDTFYYLRLALNAVNELKREGVSPDDFKTILEKQQKIFAARKDLLHEKGAHKGKMKGEHLKYQKNLVKNQELSVLYADYEAALRKNKMYDYSDMIVEVVRVLTRNKELLLILQEKYQYILVDEHQDTNSAQNKILELLSGYYETPNLFVVGDEKQAIFRFQGASLENFLYFKSLYPSAKLIYLTESYRSTQTILDTARSLRKESAHLKANVGHKEKPVQLLAFRTADEENYFLAKSVEEKIASGVHPQEIAVLYRDNRDALPIARMFEKFGLPFAVESDRNILADNDIKKLILLLRAAINLGSRELLLEALHIDFLKVAPLDVYKIADYARSQRINPHEIIKSPSLLKELQLESYETIYAVGSLLSKLKQFSKNKSAAEVFEDAVRESGFLSYILTKPDHLDKLDKLSALSDELRKLIEVHKDVTLGQFLEYVDMLEEHDVLIKNSGTSYKLDRARLMTAHKSKGQEFEYVYIVNVYDTHWGNRRRVSHFEMPLIALTNADLHAESRGHKGVEISSSLKLASSPLESTLDEDERNLFYVALTRAKKEVFISYAKSGANGREQLPSKFIEELDKNLIENGDAARYEKELGANQEILYAPAKLHMPNIKDKEFVGELFEKYGLSVTALNNYLECPWRYFYSNLVRIPESPNKHLMYGNAVHNALKDFFDKFSEGDDRGAQFLIKRFRESLRREPIEENDYKEVLVKGEKALTGYYGTYKGKWPINIINEFNIKSVDLALASPKLLSARPSQPKRQLRRSRQGGLKVRLTGKIDKLEILDASNRVNVVDYKTGKPKTRGEIEGLTANSDGEYKRQLVFYKLLLDNYADGKYKMVSGGIDFIEPDQKGRYHRESFMVTTEEVVALSELVRKVSGEILGLEFWDKTCGEKDCKFCELRSLMT
ncbi:MAG: ATP-dependent DNA helicase, partial [bacterium]|nr:ATP-dependent DNA helicase [bacterium]